MYEDFYTPGLPSYKNANPQIPARLLTYWKIKETPNADCIGRPSLAMTPLSGCFRCEKRLIFRWKWMSLVAGFAGDDFQVFRP